MKSVRFAGIALLFGTACLGGPESNETSSAGLEPAVCGMRVDELLAEVAGQVTSRFAALEDHEKAWVCERVPSGAGWDIDALAFAEGRTSVSGTGGMCAADEAASGSVTVGGQCWFAGEVNYFLFGLASQLCWNSGNPMWGSREQIRGWRTNVELCGESMDVTRCRPPERWEDLEKYEQGVRGRETWYDIGTQAVSGSWTAPPSPARYAGFVPCSAQLEGIVRWHLGGELRDGSHLEWHDLSGEFESPVGP